MRISKALLKKYSQNKQNMMMTPEGKLINIDESHPDWAHNNYKKFNIDFIPDPNYESTETGEAFFDTEGNIALDKFFENDWVRVSYPFGIEGYSLNTKTLNAVKRMFREWAKNSPRDEFYIDLGDGTITIPISMTGRPDFSELNKKVAAY